MARSNKVFIATSLDGHIADKNGEIDWLHAIPNPDNIDMGYQDFITQIDAIVMGRNTFETVCNFDMDWPYEMPVFVLSNTVPGFGFSSLSAFSISIAGASLRAAIHNPLREITGLSANSSTYSCFPPDA